MWKAHLILFLSTTHAQATTKWAKRILAELRGGSCTAIWWGDECQVWWFSEAAQTVYWEKSQDSGELVQCESIYYLIREIWVLVGGQSVLQTNKPSLTFEWVVLDGTTILSGFQNRHISFHCIAKHFSGKCYIILKWEYSVLSAADEHASLNFD